MRKSVSYTHKVNVIDVFEECNDLSETIARVYGELDSVEVRNKKKQIWKWMAARVHIRAMCAIGKGRMRKLRNMGDGTVLAKEREEQIVLWINFVRR